MKNKILSMIIISVMLITIFVPALADVITYEPIVADDFSENKDGSYTVTEGSVSWSEKEKALSLSPSTTVSYSPKAGESGWSGSYSTTIKMKLKNWEETAASNMFILTTKSNASDEKYIFNYKSNGFRIDKMYKPIQYVMLTPSFSGAVKYVSDDWNTVKIENILNDDNSMTVRLYFNDDLIYDVADSSNISVNGGITIKSNLNSEMLIKSVEVTEIIHKKTVREPDAPAYDTIGDRYEDECLLVRQLGIMQDDENNMFNSGNFMTRKDFARTIVNYSDLQSSAPLEEEDSIYSDVVKSDPYYNAIYTVTAMGYMKGTGNNTFSPDDTVSLEQAAKVFVTLLGYSHLGEVKGGYPNGYMLAANQLGLLESIDKDKNFTRGVCAQLITNSLEVPICERYEYIDGTFTVKETGNTMLTLKDIINGEGILSDNGITGLVNDSDSLQGRVIIADKKMQTGETSAAKYIGYNVKYYAIAGENEPAVLIYVKPKDNNVITIAGEDVLPQTTKTSLVYADENDRERKKNISPIADMIYNGKAYPQFDATTLIPDGEVTLIDNNNDNTAEVIIVNNYESMVVEYVSEYAGSVSGTYKNSGIKSLSLKQESDKLIEIYKDGAVSDFGKIKQNDVLDVVKSKCGKYIKVIISSEKVTGVIENYDKSEEIYTIDSSVYELSKHFITAKKNYDAVEPSVGESYVFLINSRGQIAGTGTTSGKLIGYLRAVNRAGTLDTVSKLNIFTQSGEWEVFNLADKVEVDGTVYNSEAVNLTLLNPIFYEFNKDGNINNITTVTPRGNTDDGLHLDFTGELMYKSNPESFQLEYFPDDAIIFGVPKLEENKFDDSFYSVNPQFANDNTYNIELYNVGDNAAPEIILWRMEGADLNVNPAGNIMVVDKVLQKLRDGTSETAICGWYNGTYQELFLDASVVLPQFKAGELIQIRCDKNGNITKISDKLLSSDDRNNGADKSYDKNAGTYVTCTDYNASNRIVYGAVSYIDSINKRIALTVGTETKWMPLSPNGIRYYEVRENYSGNSSVSVANFDNIEYGSKVLVKLRYSYPYEAVIYQDNN
ncbi:MAG: S-layer homology domain-containing protein [Clostridia bacterium]|nr:S-layer homology domain-containing protein [Clostridia bacterium]